MTSLPTFRPARYARRKVAVVCHPESEPGRHAKSLKGRYSKREGAFVMTAEAAERLLELCEAGSV